MLERTPRSCLEDILSGNFVYLQGQDLVTLGSKSLRRVLKNSYLLYETDDIYRSSDERIMTRKTRTRRPRIPALQSGYCAVCNVHYNNVEDHVQSKKHQKLIGEDANYIALNGSLNGFLNTGSIPFLSLNGIEAIGVHDTSLEEFSVKYRRRNMPRTRAASLMCDRMLKPSPLSPAGSDITGHHLRSRRNINYMTPPLDDDSLQEKPDDLSAKPEMDPIHRDYKEYRELRSSTRALAKLTEQIRDNREEVWNSGRPKRACIKQKRVSADERLVADNKTYYRVEVMTSKLRSSSHALREQQAMRRRQSQSPKQEEDNKGLIVKFKKLRNSELVQLNTEATNFLFPKREESSEEDDDVDVDGANTTVSSVGKDENMSMQSSDAEENRKTPHKFKLEDDASMDSTCSEAKRKKRRRTHAEAFIMDNQKYYKFETPGSRLRYHGSYLPSVIKSPKHNGDCTTKVEKVENVEKLVPEQKIKVEKSAKIVLNKYKFSFEKIPQNAPWYNTFQRQDKGEQTYSYYSDQYFWDPFVLPYQMPSIPPLDPKICMNHYSQLVKCLCEPSSESNSVCSTPEPSASTSASSLYEPDLDEDSKMSATTLGSNFSLEEVKSFDKKRRGRRPRASLPQESSGKNPRKSPRQHASTLAILSSLLQQRKRRSRKRIMDESDQSLPTIPEEDGRILQSPEQKNVEQEKPRNKSKMLFKKLKQKVDYFSIARQFDDELDTILEDNFEDYELEIMEENTVDFHNSKVHVRDILKLYEKDESKETEKNCKRLLNGVPGKKPGRRKKKNKTGWPNKNRRLTKKKEKEDDNDDSTIDSMSVNMDTDEEDANSTDSIKKIININNSASKSDPALSEVSKEENCDVNRVDKREINDKILTNKVTNSTEFQPYVFVQKLDSDKLIDKPNNTPKRTNRRQRRMPGSPKSPRMLRRPRGRWYRER